MQCNICNYNCNSLKVLSIHLVKVHNFDKNKQKEYYDKFIKKDDEGKCYFCNNDAIFKGFTNGYHKICSDKKCLGKTRATGTYEFLMYKYNLSKDDAIKLMEERSLKRGIRIKDGLNNKFKENKKFFKEKSHQSKEYWIKKGFSEEESTDKANNVLNMIHKKTWDKRKNNPELYKDINSTQINYWIKKGYSINDAKEKIKERQRTFTLDICIKKYGEELGTKIFKERQIKWSEKIEKKYKNGDFVKFKNDMYSFDESELMETICNKLNINAYYGRNQFYRYFRNIGQTFSYDFVFNKKVIEFNGDYWHCNPKYYNSNYFHKYLQKYAFEVWEKDKIKIDSISKIGYDVLIIWESDYKNNKEEIIKKCINFIKND